MSDHMTDDRSRPSGRRQGCNWLATLRRDTAPPDPMLVDTMDVGVIDVATGETRWIGRALYERVGAPRGFVDASTLSVPEWFAMLARLSRTAPCP